LIQLRFYAQNKERNKEIKKKKKKKGEKTQESISTNMLLATVKIQNNIPLGFYIAQKQERHIR
jgi:hypothetical protein